MVNIYEVLQRAVALMQETALNSISPERAGGIMRDTLLALNDLWLQQGSALVISKIYASVAAMEADTAPVSDLTGKPLKPGQIVVIASSDSDNGSVYRYNGTDAPSWSLVGAIGSIPPVDSLDSDSTTLPLAAHQGKVLDGKIGQLGQEVVYPTKEYLDFVANGNGNGMQSLIGAFALTYPLGNYVRTRDIYLLIGNYKVAIRKPSDDNLSTLVLNIFNGSTSVKYISDIITQFSINDSNYAIYDLNINENATYTFNCQHAGNACDIGFIVLIDKNARYLDDVYKKRVFDSTKDLSLLLDWYQGTFNGAMHYVINPKVLASNLITQYGTYQFIFDDTNFKLMLYDGTLHYFANGDIYTISDDAEKQGFLLSKIDDSNFSLDELNNVHLTIKKVDTGDVPTGIFEVNVGLEPGIFNGGGNDVESTAYLRSPKIYCDGETLIFATAPSSIYVQCNFVNDCVSSRRNLPRDINGGLCIKSPKGFVRFGFVKRDEDGTIHEASEITNDELSKIKIYRLFRSNMTGYDVCVGAEDSDNTVNADIITNDSNAQYILNALTSSVGHIKIYVKDGIYRFSDVFISSYGAKKCLLKTQDVVNNNYSTLISLCGGDGFRKVRFEMTSAAFENMPSDSESSFILVPKRSISLFSLITSDTLFDIENIEIFGYDYTKPIVFVDITEARESKINNICVRGDFFDGGVGLHRFRTRPNLGCVGIRVGFGSNNGIGNYIKNTWVVFCGTGVSCCGEHYVFEDVLTHHCYVGFAFGDRVTRAGFQHPNIMIGCSIENCYRLMTLSKQGITTEGTAVESSTIQTWCSGLTTKEQIVSALNSHVEDYTWLTQFILSLPDNDALCVEAINNSNFYVSTLICIGMSTEEYWSIPNDELVEGEPDSQHTLPILEVLKNLYRGRIELDYRDIPFTLGSGDKIHWTAYGKPCKVGIGQNITETW